MTRQDFFADDDDETKIDQLNNYQRAAISSDKGHADYSRLLDWFYGRSLLAKKIINDDEWWEGLRNRRTLPKHGLLRDCDRSFLKKKWPTIKKDCRRFFLDLLLMRGRRDEKQVQDVFSAYMRDFFEQIELLFLLLFFNQMMTRDYSFEYAYLAENNQAPLNLFVERFGDDHQKAFKMLPEYSIEEYFPDFAEELVSFCLYHFGEDPEPEQEGRKNPEHKPDDGDAGESFSPGAGR